MIEFTVNGEPVGKARPRFTKSGHVYTPEKTRKYEELVRLEYGYKYSGFMFPVSTPVAVSISAYFSVPRGTSKISRNRMLNKKMFPTKKPDSDNIAKIVLDALNGVAYRDDAQVVSVSVEKLYSEFSHVDIKIRPLVESRYD